MANGRQISTHAHVPNMVAEISSMFGTLRIETFVVVDFFLQL
jgi:hypothetical protein